MQGLSKSSLSFSYYSVKYLQALLQNTWQIIPALLLMELVQLQLTDTIWWCGNCCWHCCSCCMNCARLAFTSWLKVSVIPAPAAAAEINLRRKTLPSVCSRWHAACCVRNEAWGMRLATAQVLFTFSLCYFDYARAKVSALGHAPWKVHFKLTFLSLTSSLSLPPLIILSITVGILSEQLFDVCAA